MRRQGEPPEPEERLTLAVDIEGTPVLVQVIDFIADSTPQQDDLFQHPLTIRAPLLVILAAGANDPSPVARSPSRGAPFRDGVQHAPEQSEAARDWLEKYGFTVRTADTGAYAVHSAAPLFDPASLPRAVDTLVEVSRAIPTPNAFAKAPRPPAEESLEAKPSEVIQTFLEGLRDEDAARAVACAHFGLWLQTEPTPGAWKDLVRGALARPLTWKLFDAGSDKMLDNEHGQHVFEFTIQGQFEGRETPRVFGAYQWSICLTRTAEGRVCVCGYEVPGYPKLFMGVFPSPRS